MPLTIDFPGKQLNEQVKMVLHRHWFVFFRKFLMVAGFAVIPVVIFLLWNSFAQWELATNSLGYALLIMAASLYALFLWLILFGFWLDFSLDYYIVTDQRVVDIEQSGLFSRRVAELPIGRVQDITSDIKGFFPTMLHYGDVYIQSAGEKERFIFEQVGQPDHVVRMILQMTNNKTAPPDAVGAGPVS